MKKFMDENFLLNSHVAERLYHEVAKDLPIIDYHCHLNPQEIYENKRFKNITEAWLYGDHYKWRAMRANGIEEKYITGDATDYDKFLAWAETVPQTIGNPLYQWTHLELQRFFDTETILNAKTAPEIWKLTNDKLQYESLTVRDLILKSNVKVICTTDDPVDSLQYHQLLADDTSFDVMVLPSFRPDKALEINRPTFFSWIEKLEQRCNKKISKYEDLLDALENRIKFFNSMGCKVSDHALDKIVYEETTFEEVSDIFMKKLGGETINLIDEAKYKSYTLTFLGEKYFEHNWAMQYHISALRNNNTFMFNQLGPDTGFDSINDGLIAEALVRNLDSLAKKDKLPKTIIYSLNPKDYYVIASIIGSFQGKVSGKIQFGTAWWFNDQKEGMLDQMKALASIGLFSRFIGMLTDSRSFLSFTRHEYFRRLVCDLIGSWVTSGEVPNDEDLLDSIVKGICYDNAQAYFDFNERRV